VRGLADQVNLSVSQLERSFTRHVGVGPKLLARQTRLSALAAEAMTCASPCWARLAAEYGYADQAHLVRDFRELTGLPPSGLAAERWPARHGCRAGLGITWCRADLTCKTGSHDSLSTDKALTAAALRSPSSAVPRRSGGLCGGRSGTGTGGPLGRSVWGQRADGRDGWSMARAGALAGGP
jgi:AraC-like DNA-binding protein